MPAPITFTVGNRRIQSGAGTFGPFTPGEGYSQLVATFDMTDLTPELVVTLWHAPDGVTWREVASSGYSGPVVDIRTGITRTSGTFGANLGTTVDGPVLTSNASQLKMTYTNVTAFNCGGGSLVVS